MEQQVDIKHIVQVLKRRKWVFILPGGLFLLLAALVTLLLPPTYKSQATILIEAQEIPENLIRSTVTGYIEERLQTITQIVLSRQNLLEIIDRFNLYPNDRKTKTTEEIVATMREDIAMEPVQAEVVNPQSGNPGTATIAFTVSYEGRRPQQVAQVANTLVSLYLEENLRARKEKAETTYDFLEKQLDELKLEIENTEQAIAQFKDVHLRELPELMELNLQTLERLQKEMDAKGEYIRTLTDRKVYLEGQLATVEPARPTMIRDGEQLMSPKEELDFLKNKYVSLKARLSDKHPDVVTLKRKIETLEQGKGLNEEAGLLREKLAKKRAVLSSMLESGMTVTVDRGKVRGTPSFDGQVVATLIQGETVSRIGEQGPWIQIRYKGNRIGWAHEMLFVPGPEAQGADQNVSMTQPSAPRAEQGSDAKYSDKHPDVIRLRNEIAGLENEIARLGKEQKMFTDKREDRPDNPAYIQLQTQITSVGMDIDNARRDLEDYRRKYDEFQGRIELTPKVEQEYRALQRDYANAQTKYQETVAKLMAAKEAKGLEESAMAEKLTLIDPPTIPEKPYKPNRLALLLIGLVMAIGVGVGSGSMAEFLDRSVHAPEELGILTGLPVLVTIPFLATEADRARIRRRKVVVAAGIVGVVVLLLLTVHLVYQPLDVIWYRIAQRF